MGSESGRAAAGGAKLGQRLVGLARLEEKIGELDLRLGEGGIERDDLAEEAERGVLVARVVLRQKHGLGIEGIGLAARLGGRLERRQSRACPAHQ